MSVHPSLTISEKDKKTRSVLKRTERIRQMQEKGNCKEGNPVYGLPKLKALRIKIKKEKIEKADTPATGAAAAAPAAGGAKEAAKGATGAPKAASKANEKK